MQPCKTGDQPYSNASPNGECSLIGATTPCLFAATAKVFYPKEINTPKIRKRKNTKRPKNNVLVPIGIIYFVRSD